MTKSVVSLCEQQRCALAFNVVANLSAVDEEIGLSL